MEHDAADTAGDTPPPPPADGGPPAGWYPDAATGRQRWWDGADWGPFAPSTGPSRSSSNGLAVLAHASLLFAGLLVPLLLHLTVGRDDPHVRRHAREALNFHITLVLGWLLLAAVVVAGAFATLAGSTPDELPALFVLVPVAALGYWLGALVLAVIACVRAGKGEPYRYPLTLRLVGRAEDREERATLAR